MTDKQLDEILRKSLAPTQCPPELQEAAPRSSAGKKWIGAAAACLCLTVSAGVFLSMGLSNKGMDFAAPESAADADFSNVEGAFPGLMDGAGDVVGNTESAVPEEVPETSESLEAPQAPMAPMLPDDGDGDQLPGAENPGKPVVPTDQAKILDGTSVIAIACSHAGVPSDKLWSMMLTMDDDEAVKHFDMEFRYEGMYYFYEIHAESGEILTAEKVEFGYGDEQNPIAPSPVTPGSSAGPVPEVAPVPIEPTPLTGVVPAETAKMIAFEDAGIEAEKAEDVTCELSFADEIGHYAISFLADGYLYQYKLHYGSGGIMSSEKTPIS